MRRAITKYTDLVGLTPEKFLNGFLKYFPVDPSIRTPRESRIDLMP
jgi:hypothetical protein